MRTFLICPVRGRPAEAWTEQVAALEAEGWEVHWPPRDTDQSDPTGIQICTDNVAAIRKADVVHVIWDGQSQGCLFDLGAAFAMMKRIIPIELPDASDGKSFQNMVRAWAARMAE